MSEKQKLRSYHFHGIEVSVSCSNTIASALDTHFRLLGSIAQPTASIVFNFQTVSDKDCHAVEKPESSGTPFYEFESGEALYFRGTDQLYLNFGDGVRVLCRPSSGDATFSVIESDPVNLFMATHLMFTIVLVEMLKRQGCYSVHAAGFCKNGKAILIPGTSGAGKSTLAITLLRSGFGYLSDDMVFLRRNTAGLRVLGFPEDVDVSDQTIRFFPELKFLEGTAKTRGWSKNQVRADEVYGAELVGEAEPGAIVLPQIAHRDTSTLRRISPDEALVEIVSNVLLTESRSCQGHLNALTELVMNTPCYRLETGRDFDQIPTLLSGLPSADREAVYA